MYGSTADLSMESLLAEDTVVDKQQIERPIADYIFIPDNYEYFKVRLDHILYIEADGSYVKICTRNKTYQISTNLKCFSHQFQHTDFIRVSRKHIVNISYIERINGVYLILRDCAGDDHKIPFSKRKRHEILAELPIIKIKH